jgi:HSP20 family molecular chaperone IbpA
MEVIDLPEDTCIETARSTYKNGIFEIITFNKKQKTKPKEEQISIE